MQALAERLETYQCEYDSCGLDVRVSDGRMIIYFGMQIDYGDAYGAFGEEVFEGLADLFAAARDELLAGDLSVAWALFQTYGYGEDDGPEPVKPLSPSGNTLLGIITTH